MIVSVGLIHKILLSKIVSRLNDRLANDGREIIYKALSTIKEKPISARQLFNMQNVKKTEKRSIEAGIICTFIFHLNTPSNYPSKQGQC